MGRIDRRNISLQQNGEEEFFWNKMMRTKKKAGNLNLPAFALNTKTQRARQRLGREPLQPLA